MTNDSQFIYASTVRRQVAPFGFSIQGSIMIGPTLFTMTIVLLFTLAILSTSAS